MEIVDELRIHCCRLGQERIALSELESELPHSEHAIQGPGVIRSSILKSDLGRTPILAFCTQVLPCAYELKDASVSAYALRLVELCMSEILPNPRAWRVDIFETREGKGVVISRRCQLIREAFEQQLHKRRRALLRMQVSEESDSRLPEDAALFQVCLLSPTHGFVSLALPELVRRLQPCLSLFAGGIVPIVEDKRAPSRAYQKLLEVEQRLGIPIRKSQVCVDLGGAPGGWTYVALERGARVIAIDRSPLRDDLMNSTRVDFRQGDAFRFQPEAPVDWLLCDVAAFPEKSIELLENWLRNGWSTYFVVTLKFRGKDDYQKLDSAKAVLRAHASTYDLRQLKHNKNEVTAFGVCASKRAQAVPR